MMQPIPGDFLVESSLFYMSRIRYRNVVAMHPYLPHVLYSVALTSLSMHLLVPRQAGAEQRARISGQLSLLESLAQTLRSNAPISEAEVDKLKKLARAHARVSNNDAQRSGLSWRDVFRSSRNSESGEELSEWDKKDIELGATTV